MVKYVMLHKGCRYQGKRMMMIILDATKMTILQGGGAIL